MSDPFAIVNVRVLLGQGTLSDVTSVWVTDGRIMRIGSDAGECGDMQTWDAAGGALLPGLIDAHVHLCLDSQNDDPTAWSRELAPHSAIRGSVNAAQTLDAGYTTVRDCGALGYANIAVAQAIRNALVDGPRVLASGPWMSITGRHEYGRWRPEIHVDLPGRVDSPDEARRVARQFIYYGADFIKLRATGNVHTDGTEPGQAELTEAEMRAAVEVAHDKGVRVAAHAHGLAGIKNALRAGVDTIEHGSFLDAEAVSMMIERGVYLVPTLSFTRNMLNARSLLPPYVVRKAELVRSAQLSSFRLALDAGVRIAAGSDAGMAHTHHGRNSDELVWLVEAGMSPAAAILAATKVAAEALGIDEMVGTVEPGKVADLILVRGDPVRDVSILQDRSAIQMIIREGRVHYRGPGLAVSDSRGGLTHELRTGGETAS